MNQTKLFNQLLCHEPVLGVIFDIFKHDEILALIQCCKKLHRFALNHIPLYFEWNIMMRNPDEEFKRCCSKNNEAAMLKFVFIGHVKMIEYIQRMKMNININVRNGTSLYLACHNGHLEMVQYLFNLGIRSYSALVVASANGHLPVVEFLLRYHIEHYTKDNLLHHASRNGHASVVEFLLKNGANTGFYYWDLLTSASGRGHTEVVRLLLKYGMNVHHNNDYALIKACSRNYISTVKCLLDHGANVHALDNMPLKKAAEYGHFKTIKHLISHGANWFDFFILMSIAKHDIPNIRIVLAIFCCLMIISTMRIICSVWS
jgi:ankyrin repeat protein